MESGMSSDQLIELTNKPLVAGQNTIDFTVESRTGFQVLTVVFSADDLLGALVSDFSLLKQTDGGGQASDVASTTYTNLIGDKRYELSNHLGNVLSVITDRKIVADSQSETVVPIQTSIYTTNFETSTAPWQKTTQATSLTMDSGRLAVTTAKNNHGAHANYFMHAGRTYEISMSVDKSAFTPDIEVGVWKGNSRIISERLTDSGDFTTTVTIDESRNYRIRTRLKESGYSGADQTYYLDNIQIKDITATEDNPPYFVTDFTADIKPWKKSNNTTSISSEAGKLKVVTGKHHNGANANYYLIGGKTYQVSVDVVATGFAPALEIGVWNGNSKVHTEIFNENGTYTTTFTTTDTRNYRLNARLKENGYIGPDQTFYLDNVVITEVVENNSIFTTNSTVSNNSG